MKYGSAYWQCEAYRRLVNAGFHVHPEFRIGRLRADLAVLVEDKVVLLIEAKSVGSRFGLPGHWTRQWGKYQGSGHKFLLVQDECSMAHVMEWLAARFPISARLGPDGAQGAEGGSKSH